MAFRRQKAVAVKLYQCFSVDSHDQITGIVHCTIGMTHSNGAESIQRLVPTGVSFSGRNAGLSTDTVPISPGTENSRLTRSSDK